MRGRVFSARFALTRIAFMISISLMTYAASLIGADRVYCLSGLLLLIGTTILVVFSYLRTGNSQTISR
jgi:Na+/melibiose symporter-like transporter